MILKLPDISFFDDSRHTIAMIRVNWDVLKLIVKCITDPWTLLTVAKSNKRLYNFVKNEVCLVFKKGLLEWNTNDGSNRKFVRYWYDDGKPKFDENYVNVDYDGVQQYWYDNGKLMYKYNYVNDKKEGVQLYWYQNGQQMSKRNYIRGKKEGIQQDWNPSGQLWYEDNYVNGNLIF